jgi:hypothetical protein
MKRSAPLQGVFGVLHLLLLLLALILTPGVVRLGVDLLFGVLVGVLFNCWFKLLVETLNDKLTESKICGQFKCKDAFNELLIFEVEVEDSKCFRCQRASGPRLNGWSIDVCANRI